MAGHAQLAVYSFTGNTANVTSVASNLSAGAISTNSSLSVSNGSPVSSGYAGASGSYYGSDNGWGSAGNFFQFTLMPAAGQSLSITGLSFGYRTSGTSGPNAFAIRSSNDNYAANLASGALTNTDTNWHSSGTVSITMSGITTATTFRIYGSGASTNTPTLRLDDIVINGALTAVPEPASAVALLGLAGLLMAVIRRRVAT